MSQHHITVHGDVHKGTINKNIYGHFSEHLGRCIYGGLYVGEDSAIPNVKGMRSDVVAALKHIEAPVIRWPGGCFADEYHWKDGIGDKAKRKRMVNTHWGGVVEDNSFGTHEYMELCRQVGCEPYINGNLGSGTVQEMQEWVEYLTFGGVSPMSELRKEHGQEQPWKVKYFGVGNENWGCGGNMTPEYYANEFRRYQTYLRNFDGNVLCKIACGPSDADYRWTETLMRDAGRYMHALTAHYYTLPTGEWQHKGSATQFTQAEYFATLRRAAHIDTLIAEHSKIMDKYDPEHRVGLIYDEWGTWYDVEPGTNPGFLYQQNSMRDAMVAALTLHIFNHHCDRVVMANIAQTVNVLQAVILTDGDRMVLTPTYHVFDLFKAHQDGILLDSVVGQTQRIGMGEDCIAQVSVSASIKEGRVTITLVNTAPDEAAEVTVALSGVQGQGITGRILTGAMDAYNDFDQNRVQVAPFDGAVRTAGGVQATLPPCSVVTITIA